MLSCPSHGQRVPSQTGFSALSCPHRPWAFPRFGAHLVLESAMSPQTPGSLQSKMVLRNRNLGSTLLIAIAPLLFSGPLCR